MRPRAAALAGIVAFAMVLAGAPVAQAQRAGPPDLTQAARAIVERTNVLRAENGLPPTTPEPTLARTAAAFAAYMAQTGRYGHDADGRQPADRTQAQGYAHCSVSENIAYQRHSRGFETAVLARELAQGWAKSPPHRRNMLDPDVTETGVALAHAPVSDRYYAVQLFGRPRTLEMRLQLANEATEPVAYDLDGESLTLRPRTVRTHTLCSAGELRLRLPGERAPRLVQAADGRRYTLARVQGAWRVDEGAARPR